MNFDEQCYVNDPYRLHFSARVVSVEPAGEGLSAVYLEETYFYPDSGGQPDDRGTLDGKPVVDVTETGTGVRHLVRGDLRTGDIVEGYIDGKRRLDHMQHHTGQHLLSRVFLDRCALATVSFHLGEETCTIDLEGEVPSAEELSAVEGIANDLIFKNLPVSSRVVSADEFERMAMGGGGRASEGERSTCDESGQSSLGMDEGEVSGRRLRPHVPLLRSRLPEGVDRVRIVEIEGVDAATCCGTHVRATGEIGIIKILGLERTRGSSRVEFLCGGRAVRDYGAKHELLSAVAAGQSADWRDLPRLVEKASRENRELRKRCEELGRELAAFRAVELSKPTGSIGGYDVVKRVFSSQDVVALRETASTIRETGKTIVLFGLSGPTPALLFACSPGVPVDMGDLMRKVAGTIGARGGGGKDFAQGGGGDGSRVAEAVDEAERRVRAALGG
jgi:alanyl-tRNA synthetase